MKKILLASILTLTAASANALEYWIGRPTTGDYLRKSLSDAVRAGAQYRKSVGSFESEIERARLNYFNATGGAREAAGEELAKLLFSKDIFIAIFYLPNGFNAHTNAVNQMFGALNNNRQVDGGIRTPARPAFDRWILAMRTSLGAKSENDMLLISSDSLERALLATRDSYEKYRNERDLAEMRSWKSAHPEPHERVGSRPLHATEVEDLVPLATGLRTVSDNAYGRALTEASKTSKLLVCSYGPTFDASGGESFGKIAFWKDRAPANLSNILELNEKFMKGLKERALASCPKTESEAIAKLNAPSTYTISPEAKEQVKVELEKDKVVADEKARQAKRLEEAYRELRERNAAEAAKANAESAAKRKEQWDAKRSTSAPSANSGGRAYSAPIPPNTAPQPIKITSDTFVGKFRGTYVCRQGRSGMTLELNQSSNSIQAGKWEFFPIPENPKVPYGSLEVRARVSTDGVSLIVDPGRWIVRPNDYSGVSIKLRPDGRGGLVGTMQSSTCGEIKLARG